MDNAHVRSMHDNLKPMFNGIPVDWSIQWSKDGKPVYQVEPLINANGTDLQKISELKGYNVKVYDFDKRNTELLKSLGFDADWRPCLLNQAMLDWVGSLDQDRDIDVLHIGNKSDRRQPIIETLEKMNGIKFVNVTNVYGAEATKLMKRAKVVLNVHRESAVQAQEQLRIMWAIACGCVVVSEPSIEPSIPNHIVTECILDNIVSVCVSRANSWSKYTAELNLKNYFKLSEEYYRTVWGFGADQIEVIDGLKEVIETNKGAIDETNNFKTRRNKDKRGLSIRKTS